MELWELHKFIADSSKEIALKIRQIARLSRNEAELRSNLGYLFKDIAKTLNVKLIPREEYTLASGRADAVFNRIVIEYKAPGFLKPSLNSRNTAHAVEQLKNYLKDLSKRDRRRRERLMGIILDGYFYVFIRYHTGEFSVDGPFEVNPRSTEKFLRILLSLSSGRALISDNLVEDFGSESELVRSAVRALYQALAKHSDNFVSRLFEQWRLFFGEVAGYEAAAGRIRHRKQLLAFAHSMGLNLNHFDIPKFFFAVHTYFSFIVKNIARLVLQVYSGGKFGAPSLKKLAVLTGEPLRTELERMENGAFFKTLGILNLLEGDFFAWYLKAWNPKVENALVSILNKLGDYNPTTIEDDPHSVRDLLKKLYHYLLPKEIRHDLGEYYTPDWLAERLLEQLNEPLFQKAPTKRILDPNKRLLDPACGSGTFLVLAIRAAKQNLIRAGYAESAILDLILKNIVGIDLNPLAVLAARVNYLLAIADLLPFRQKDVEIPIYLADSILTPHKGAELYEQNRIVLDTVVGKFQIPSAVNTRRKLERLTNILEEYVESNFSVDAFVERCKSEIEDLSREPEAESTLKELFEKFRSVYLKGFNGIWARIMKNAFMPIFLEKFDYVVGNPPWVNWESLPEGYREQTAELWQKYELFPHKGFDAILGKGKDDISILMTYVAIDKYLKDKGKLGFVITQSVFKSSGAGRGFRKFRFSNEQDVHLKVIHVDDMSELQPFEGATNRTAVVIIQKGLPTEYPVPYTYWKKVKRSRLDYNAKLDEIKERTKRLHLSAAPIDESDPTSPWLTARPKVIGAIRKVLGKSEYRARAGVSTGGANGVFWLKILTVRPDGPLVVENLTEGAKREVEQVMAAIEPDLVYPLLRGRDVRRWYAKPSCHILLTHLEGEGLKAIPPDEMQRKWPKTWIYLTKFEQVLRERSGFTRYFTRKGKDGETIETGPFYSMFNIGDYTFSTWKVVWREQSAQFTCAAVGSMDSKAIIPDHKLMLVPCENASEAYYLAGVLNSKPVALAVLAYVIPIQQTTHILENVFVPKYDPSNPVHQRLSELSRRAHEVALRAYDDDEKAEKELNEIEKEIDKTAAAIWKLSDKELQEIKRNLTELKR